MSEQTYGPGAVVGLTKPGHCGHGYKTGECPIHNPQEPQVRDGVETHPAYAQIGAARVSGRAHLYGSDFDHQHFVTVWIKRSELQRDLSHDWAHAREELVEIAMSEAQWATFVSSPNQGDGVQCTLLSKDGRMVSRLPAPQRRTEQFAKEMRDRLENALGDLKNLREHLAAGKGGKRALDLLDSVERQLLNNTEYVAGQFGAHMEKTVERAKVEINAYMQNTINRLGLEAAKGTGPLALEEEGS